MMDAPGDYSAAHVYHWLDADAAANFTSGVLEAEKAPLENFVFYNYPNEPPSSYVVGDLGQPSAIGRVLDDGSSQVSFLIYNAQGNILQQVDPAGRTTNFVYYPNGIDVQKITQANGGATDTIAQFGTYNAQHRPASITDAAGQTTSFTYNPLGQILTVSNALHQTTTYSYNARYQLQGVSYPVAASGYTCLWDGKGRVGRITDSEGAWKSFQYDDLDRLVQVDYPDGTFEKTIYDRLDPVWTQDRLGRWTFASYNPMRRLSAVLDPQGRWQQYDWCMCGALKGIIDGQGNRTGFTRDVQGRVTAKTYADNTAIGYVYEQTTSRLKKKTDPNQQSQTYSYTVDDNLAGIAYTIPVVQPPVAPTPNTAYTYEPAYNRLSTASVTGGEQTTYSYYPAGGLGAGRPSSIAGRFYTLGFTYDELGRRLSRSVDAGNNESYTYDTLGRTATVTNNLGAFTYAYVNATDRLQSVTSPSSPIATAFTYYGSGADERLQSIQHTLPGSGNALLSQHSYTYDAAGRILTWQQNRSDYTNPHQWNFTYDNADELTSGTSVDLGTGATIEQEVYAYDAAGNRTLAQTGGTPSTGTFNTLNQLTALQTGGAGQLGVIATVNKPVTNATINGAPANVAYSSTAGTLQAVVPMQLGSNPLTIAATDLANGQQTTKSYNAQMSAAANRTPTYDQNGDTLSDGQNRSYQWDAAGRLASIQYVGTTNHTDFTYDAAGRFVRLVEVNGATVAQTRQFVWNGTKLAGERNAENQVVRRYFSQGEQIVSGTEAGSLLYYTRDHLGSVREAVDGLGVIRSRYDYDPYGQSGMNLIVSAGVETTFRYTGHLFHGPSRLSLSLHRAYDAEIAKWLSRDPIAEGGGINLFEYVLNSPTYLVDPLGLSYTSAGAAIGGAIGGSLAFAASLAADAGTGGANLPATFAEVGAGASLGALAGSFLGALLDGAPSSGTGDFCPLANNSSYSPGFWPADKGAAAWGRRHGNGARDGVGRFHGIKQDDPGSRPDDPYGVNPETGDVEDPDGENVGNLGEVKPK